MILLVSPDPTFARTLAHRLAVAAHRTVTVATAADALAQVGRSHFDVVLVDAELGDALIDRLDAKTPTIMLLNRGSLDEVITAVDAIAPFDAPLSNSA